MKEEFINNQNNVHAESLLLRISSLLNHNGKAEGPEQQHLRTTRCAGFTLIELLVVVLIIGILSAIALPQYQKAVEKARLATWMPFVQFIYNAEEAYYLANGTYTDDLEALGVYPPQSGCTYKTNDQYGKYYDCPGYNIGVWGPSNAQYQTSNIAFLKHFVEAETRGITYKKGERWCFSKTQKYRDICKSLGPGTEYEDTPWLYKWKLD